MAQFSTFMVCIGGFALVFLRRSFITTSSRASVWTFFGFSSLAIVSFLQGFFLLEKNLFLDVAQVVGAVSCFIGSFYWSGSARSRFIFRIGLAILAIGSILDPIANIARPIPELSILAGSIFLGVGLFSLTKKAVAARVAGGVAIALLAVVLLLSIVLSQILIFKAKSDARYALTSTIFSTASGIEYYSKNLIGQAGLVRATLQTSGLVQSANSGNAGSRILLQKMLNQISSLPDTGIVWMYPNSSQMSVSTSFTKVFGTQATSQLSHLSVITKATTTSSPQTIFANLQGIPTAIGVYPNVVLNASGKPSIQGIAIVVQKIRPIKSNISSVPAYMSIEIVSPSAPFEIRATLSKSLLNKLTFLVNKSKGGTAYYTQGSQAQLLAQSLRPSSSKYPLMLVGRVSYLGVGAIGIHLFRLVFFISVGVSLLAVLLATILGDQLASGLRHLTSSARAIQRGETGVRSLISAEDEIGELSLAFDSMIASIEYQQRALKKAFEDDAILRNRLESVITSMAEALIAIDSNGAITDFNVAAEQLFEIKKEQVKDKNFQDIISIVDSRGVNISSKLLRSNLIDLSQTHNLFLHVPTSDPIPIEVFVKDLINPMGESMGSVLVVRDMRKEYEIEKMKNEFLSRIGHELRTPLTVIMGYAELLDRKGVPDPRAGLGINEILSQSKRLLRTIEILEFFASSAAGRSVFRLERLEIDSLLVSVVQQWRDHLQNEYRLKLIINVNQPCIIYGDKQWLRLALDEVIDNAVKFSEPFTTVEISLNPQDAYGIEIIVKDQGRGMNEEEQMKAFADFSQGDSSDTRSFGGLGLGFSLAKRVTEGHKGRIECISHPGSGTQISMLIPLRVELDS